MAPKVDDIIQTTTAEDVLDSSSGSSSYDNSGLNSDFDLDDYLDDYDLDNYDLDDYNLDDYGLDDYDPDDYDLDNYDDYFDDDDSGDSSGDSSGNSSGDSGDSRNSGDSDNSYSGDYSDFSDSFDSDDFDTDDVYYAPGVGISNAWYYGAAGLHGVGLLAFIALLLVALFTGLRKKDGRKGDKTKPVISIILSLGFFILWSIFAIVDTLAWTGIGIGQDPRSAITILRLIFFSVAQILVFSVFYRLLADRFDRLSSSSGFHKLAKLVHWGILGLLTILYFVRIILNIVVEVKQNNFDLDLKLRNSSAEFSAALDILSWLASLEILACAVLVLVQSRSSLGGSIASPIALIIAAFAFFISWLTAMIISIRFSLVHAIQRNYVIIPQTLFAIACPIVMYIAFILILAKSDRWETPKDQAGQPQPPEQPVQYQQPMGEPEYQQPQYQQPQPQYAPVPGPSPVSYTQPTPQPQQVPGTPPAQSQYQQPQTEYAQPQAQYAQVPVPAAYPPSGSPRPA